MRTVTIETTFIGDDRFDLPKIKEPITLEEIETLQTQLGFLHMHIAKQEFAKTLEDGKLYYHNTKHAHYFIASKIDDKWVFELSDKDGIKTGKFTTFEEFNSTALRLVANQPGSAVSKPRMRP